MINECKIIKELAIGGQKVVTLAEHAELGKVVIKKGSIQSFISLERIRREVDFLSGLDSVYYPKQYFFNIDVKNKTFEIIEEYIEGRTLRDAMVEYNTPEKIFRLIKKITEALHLIWSKRIVHRDLKPENIIIRPDGNICIIDLGIARFLDLDSLTQSISPYGPCTPVYASPEQLANKKDIIDMRTDFFNLGLIALELYLGFHPYDPEYVGNEYSIVENILSGNYYKKEETNFYEANTRKFIENTLQDQPYNRFRNYLLLDGFVNNIKL